MLAASHSLVTEGAAIGAGRTLAGILIGLLLILLANTLTNREEGHDVAELAGADARKALPAFLFVLVFEPFLPVGLGLAAGAMIWMVFAELIPDALEEVSGATVGAAVTLAFAALFAFQHFGPHM